VADILIEVRIHCKGGQGGVTAARILGLAAVKEGKHAIAFPAFTVERRGAPIMAFVRISNEPILNRSFIYNPDYVLVFDPALLTSQAVMVGVKGDTCFIVNSKVKPSLPKPVKSVAWLDADKVALEVLKAPIVNTVMCGAFAAISKLLSLKSVEEAVSEILPKHLIDVNVKAVVRGYQSVVSDSSF